MPSSRRALDGVEQGVLPGRVALRALEAPLPGPPAVPVHDHRHVAGDPGGVEVGRQHGARPYPSRS